MSKTTTIPYCDSTFNLMAGCNGCELWNASIKSCYAGNWIEANGEVGLWPEHFERPLIYPRRMKDLRTWDDLVGTERPDKPWIRPDFPRIVFLNDMGDTFTEGLTINWMTKFVEEMATMPHIFLLLTKRVRRMESFWKYFGNIPDNFVLGTSVTNQKSTVRISMLERINSRTRFLSIEPMVENIDLSYWLSNVNPCESKPFDWVIVGGESGIGARPFQSMWAKKIQYQCFDAGIPFFMKQMGGENDRRERMNDLPESLQVREFPALDELLPRKQPKLFD